MTFDDGIVAIYERINTAGKGEMPKPALRLKSRHYFAYETLGYGRYYQAKKIDDELENVIDIERDRTISNKDIVITEDDGIQYQISMVQHPVDEDGLHFTRVTLSHLNEKFEFETETIQ